MAGAFLGAHLDFYFSGTFKGNFEPQAKIRICTFKWMLKRESKSLCIGCRELLDPYSDGLKILGVSSSEVQEELSKRAE